MNQVVSTSLEAGAHKGADVEFLHTVEPFAVFPERWLLVVAGLMRAEAYGEGELIFRAGDRSDAMFVVRSGQVVVFSDTVGEPVRLRARVNPGELFGEVGVLERSRRTASARAAVATRVLRLEAVDLRRLARASRRFGARLTESALLRHLQESASGVERGRRGDVRIRVDQRITLESAAGEVIRPLLDNLSRGGACLREVPESWNLSAARRICARLEDSTELFQVRARIAWRRRTSVGLAFADLAPDHRDRIDAALAVLLSAPRSPASNSGARPSS